jgi:uncharacterized protein YecE (DUF72 family)
VIYVGTSGFAYGEWKGGFYPESLSGKEFLAFYSRHFATTEVNYTFYRIPSAKTTASWVRQVPVDFRFSVKLSRRISHSKRLRDVGEEMEWFRRGVEPLRDRLGCVLVQLPPWARQDLDALRRFLDSVDGGLPLAFEFRHESWLADATLEAIQQAGAALVLSETDDSDCRREVPGAFLYLRLRKSEYRDADLADWARWLNSLKSSAFVYLKHSERAPELARKLLDCLGGNRPRSGPPLGAKGM